MSQPARKPDPTSGKLAESLSVDDPSIPVLTERLTLPPLDLDLEFRLPERPLPAEEKNTVAPITEAPLGPPTEASLEASEWADALETIVPLDADQPHDPVAQEPEPRELPLPEQVRPNTVIAAGQALEPPEASETSPRVPTSLLVSNPDSLLSPPLSGSPYREPSEFDLTQSDGIRANRMEANLREMILLELARRLPTEVESIVRRHLEGAIDEAIRRFTVEVRIALAGSLREMVDRAVKAELDRLNVPRS